MGCTTSGAAAVSTLPSAPTPRGVSLAFLHDFASARDTPTFRKHRTCDVIALVVKPHTAAAHCAFIDLYNDARDASGTPYIGTATVYVSHAWNSLFLDLVAVLEAHKNDDDNNKDAYFWIDAFCLNQNDPVQHRDGWLTTSFRQTIARIGTVLVVMSPWHAPLPLSRAWCLWEIIAAIDLPGVNLILKQTTTDFDLLAEGVTADPMSVVNAVNSVNAATARASLPSDQDMIHHAIESTCGYEHVNHKVKEQLREWLITAMLHIDAQFQMQYGDKSVEAARWRVCCGYVMHQLGVLYQASHMLESALEILAESVGADSLEVASLRVKLGKLYVQQGSIEQAELVFNQAMAAYQQLLPSDDEMILSLHNDMDALQRRMSKRESIVDIEQRRPSTAHNSQRNSVNDHDLTPVTHNSERRPSLLERLRPSASVGRLHRDVPIAESTEPASAPQQNANDIEKVDAIAFITPQPPPRSITIDVPPSTDADIVAEASMSNASTTKSLDLSLSGSFSRPKRDSASDFTRHTSNSKIKRRSSQLPAFDAPSLVPLRDALKAARDAHGMAHPDTAQCMIVIGIELVALKQYTEAIDFLTQATEISVQSQGEFQAQSEEAVLATARCYELAGNLDKSVEAYTRCMAIQQHIYSSGIHAIETRRNIARILSLQGKNDEALVHLSTAAKERRSEHGNKDLVVAELCIETADVMIRRDKGVTRDALEEYQKAATILGAIASSGMVYIATLTKIGSCFYHMGINQIAIQHVEQAMAVCEVSQSIHVQFIFMSCSQTYFGHDCAAMAECRKHRGRSKAAVRDFAGAIADLTEALRIYALPANSANDDVVDVHEVMGLVYQSKGEREMASQLTSESDEPLDPVEPDTAAAAESFVTSIKCFQNAIQVVGALSQASVKYHLLIADTQERLKNPTAAVQSFEQALSILQMTLPPDQRHQCELHKHIAQLCRQLGHTSTERAHVKQALALHRSLDGEAHPDTVATQQWLDALVYVENVL